MDVLAVKHAIIEFGITQAQIGAYAGLSAARMSRGLASELNGEAPFTPSELQLLADTILAMRSLQESIPVPIAWAQTTKVKSFVDKHRAELHDQKDPLAPPRQWYVRLNSLTWLSRMRGDEPIPTYNFQVDGAAFKDMTMADEVVRRLRAVGVQSKTDLLTADRKSTRLTRSLTEIGFEPVAIEEVIGAADGN